jgi:hypothetical protein
MNSRIFAAIIAVIAWLGLAVQFAASFVTLGSVIATLWVMLLYFTIIANLAVAVVFTGTALGSSRLASPFLLAGTTIAVLLVGIVYNVLLQGMIELSGGAKLADRLNHSVTPVTVSLFWLFAAEKGHLHWRDPLRWALLPLAYFAYGITRGATEGQYPYPFMNLARLGWPQTLVNAAVMAACFLAVGFAMVWLDRRLGRRHGLPN